MLNQVVLVGRLAKEIEIIEDKKVAKMVLAVPRNFKNADGEYDKDFIPCILYNGIAENTIEYCKQGDLVGVKGRIQLQDEIEIIAEKITFLSNKK